MTSVALRLSRRRRTRSRLVTPGPAILSGVTSHRLGLHFIQATLLLESDKPLPVAWKTAVLVPRVSTHHGVSADSANFGLSPFVAMEFDKFVAQRLNRQNQASKELTMAPSGS
jgi:hypothetical protein